MAGVGHSLVRERCLRILDSICDTSRWPNIPFHCVIKNITMFSSCWCDTYQWWRGGLSLVYLFSSSSSFLFSLLKITTWLSLILVFKFQSLFLIFFSWPLWENLNWFSISSFNPNLWYFFFQFNPHCFEF